MSWLVVGLGNPGNEYSATRHNIGFQVADYLAAQVAGKFSKHKSKAEVLEGRFGVGVDAPKIIIAKPQTYMNDSGKSVVALRNFYQLSNSQIIVIHDELDISVIDDNQAKKIVEIMENAVTLAIPNKVDYESGETWGDIYG